MTAPLMATSVTLESATSSDAALLSNLLELYIHDMSAFFPHVELGADGRYGYPHLESYLSGSNERHAFLVRYDGRIAGFVLVRRGSPVSDDPSVLDIAEFFVLRQFRACGVGRAAAALVWDRLPGSWTIRVTQRNPDGVRFWRGVVAEYTKQRATETKRVDGATEWVVLRFDNSS